MGGRGDGEKRSLNLLGTSEGLECFNKISWCSPKLFVAGGRIKQVQAEEGVDPATRVLYHRNVCFRHTDRVKVELERELNQGE